jgi:hypothetical protein
MSNAGGMSTVTRYTDMLAGNSVWNPWEPQGAYDALSTVTVPSGGLASITFAGIPNTYKHLQIRAIGRTTASAADSLYRFNSDTGSNYALHLLVGNGTTAQAFSGVSQTSLKASPYLVDTANVFGAGVTDILDYASTSKNKTVRTLTGFDDNTATYSQIQLFSGLWMNTAAINSITITPSAGTYTQNSQFTLYGVR